MNKSAIQKRKKEGEGKKQKEREEVTLYSKAAQMNLKGTSPLLVFDGKSLLSLAAGDPL